MLAGPGKETAVADLEAGQHVVVCGPEGGTAKTVMVPPKPGRRPSGQQGSQQQGQGQMPQQGSQQGQGQMPPPPGGQFGGPQGAPGQMQG